MQLQKNISTTFTNIFYIPSLFINLLSGLALFTKGCKVHFEESSCSIYCPDGTRLGTGIQKRNLLSLYDKPCSCHLSCPCACGRDKCNDNKDNHVVSGLVVYQGVVQ